MTLAIYIIAVTVGVIISTLFTRMIGNWFTRENLGILLTFVAEIAFLLGSVVILLLLVVLLSANNMDLKEGLSIITWLSVMGVAVVLVTVLGGLVYSLILPLSFAAATAACFFSHAFIFVVIYVGLLVLTDIRVQLPIYREPIVVNTDDDGSLGLISATAPVDESVQENVPVKTKMVTRRGYVVVPVKELNTHIGGAVKYELPNGVSNQGVLLGVGKRAIEIKQKQGSGSITYTVLRSEIKRISVYRVWKEQVEVK